MKESQIEEKFCEVIKSMGGRAYKFVSPGCDGVPDRLVILPGGRFGFVELKRPGQKPRKLQAHRMAELKALGCFTAVVDSPESAREVAERIWYQKPQQPIEDRLFLELVNRPPGRGAL